MAKPLQSIIYRDLDFRFEIHPVTRRLRVVENTDAIKQALENLILLDKYEAFFQPDLQTNLRGSLFDNLDSGDIELFKQKIKDVVRNFEPRASDVDVRLKEDLDHNRFYVAVYFIPENGLEPVLIELFLKKVR